MLGRLLKFILYTRFSKPLLAIMTIMLLVYCVVIGSFFSSDSSPLKFLFQYYGVGTTTFLLASAAFGRGMIVMKSDRDYLFTLPVEKKELALSLYIAQIISVGAINLVIYSVINSFLLAEGISYIVLLIDLVALTMLIASISVMANIMVSKLKIVFGCILILWTLSSLGGFAFSPGSVFTGNIFEGSIAMLSLAITVTAVAFKELSNVEFKTMDALVKATSSDAKNIRTFEGISPFKAIFSLNFHAFEFSTPFNIGVTSGNQHSKKKISRVMLSSCILSVVYSFIVLISYHVNLMAGNLVVIFVPIGIMYIIFFISQNDLAKERAWLAFTSMDPLHYFRYVCVAKVLSLVAIFSPFVIANIALSFLGFQNTLAAIVPLLITIPCSAVLLLYWASISNPAQLKEEVPTLSAQLNLKQLTSGIPFFIFLAAVAVSTIFIAAGIIAAIFSLGLTLFLLYNRHAWSALVEKLTENGFV